MGCDSHPSTSNYASYTILLITLLANSLINTLLFNNYLMFLNYQKKYSVLHLFRVYAHIHIKKSHKP